MRKIQRRVLQLAVSGVAVLALASSTALASDWGVRMGGSLGGAPTYAARTFFDAEKADFKYSTSGMELGVMWKDWDVSVFLQTIKSGFLNLGYAEHHCGDDWDNGQPACLPGDTTLPEGRRVDMAGMRLLGVQVGRFISLSQPKKWLRVGIPVSVGVAFFTSQSTRYDTTVRLEDTPQGRGFVARTAEAKIDGADVFAGGMNPYPVGSIGLGLRIRSAKWAEIELNVKLDNPRAPVFAWGMNFRKFED